MKKLILLMVITLVSYKSFSQNVTQENKICLDTIQAKQVIKDLISGDAAKAELEVSKVIILKKEEIIKKHEEKEIDLKNQNKNLKLSLLESNKIISNKDQLIENANNALKSEKKKSVFFMFASAFLAITTTILIIK